MTELSIETVATLFININNMKNKYEIYAQWIYEIWVYFQHMKNEYIKCFVWSLPTLSSHCMFSYINVEPEIHTRELLKPEDDVSKQSPKVTFYCITLWIIWTAAS